MWVLTQLYIDIAIHIATLVCQVHAIQGNRSSCIATSACWVHATRLDTENHMIATSDHISHNYACKLFYMTQVVSLLSQMSHRLFLYCFWMCIRIWVLNSQNRHFTCMACLSCVRNRLTGFYRPLTTLYMHDNTCTHTCLLLAQPDSLHACWMYIYLYISAVRVHVSYILKSNWFELSPHFLVII